MTHDWAGSEHYVMIRYCRKCRQRQLFIRGRWEPAPMQAPGDDRPLSCEELNDPSDHPSTFFPDNPGSQWKKAR